MFIYNITIKVEQRIAVNWLEWLLAEHLPETMKKGCFQSYRVVQLLEVDDSDGPTYAIQYRAESKADYHRYAELHAPAMQQKAYNKWGDGFIAFQSVMQVVEESG